MKKNWTRHNDLVQNIQSQLSGNDKGFYLKKKTVSNLFRYSSHRERKGVEVDLSEFDQPIEIDVENQTLDVQGAATNEVIANYTLKFGFLPEVSPGFKHITIAGAIVGIGFESTSFRHGFAHDGMLEAEVLLSDGSVVVCTADNEYADLFKALPNSFGTFGYILRVKIRLRKVTPYVCLNTQRFSDIGAYLEALNLVTTDESVDYVESLVYGQDELYITAGHNVAKAKNITSIYGKTIFYKEISKQGKIFMTAKDYLFRYDPEWFWGLPETWPFLLFRYIAPAWLRNSRTYAKSYMRSNKMIKEEREEIIREELIQDWIVTWGNARELFEYAVHTACLEGKPWMPTPITTNFSATLYPLEKNTLYFNLGSYTFTSTVNPEVTYIATRMIDEKCFSLGGIKMLYSTSFFERPQFDMSFNGLEYTHLKAKYDSNNLLGNLYLKAKG